METSNADRILKWSKAGKELGLEGDALRSFVDNGLDADEKRDLRAMEREREGGEGRSS